MKYSTKLYLALAGTALVSAISGLTAIYFEFRHHAFKDEQSKSMTVAATAAALLDPELFRGINFRVDEQTPQYAQAKAALIKARNANRRSDIYIKFLYTMKPNPGNSGQMIYVVDAEEDPSQISHVGDIDDNIYYAEIINHLKEYYSPNHFIADEWGVWVSGFAPIYDKEGNYVATVGADISIDNYLADVSSILQLFSAGLIVSFLFAFGGGYVLSRRITQALNHLMDCIREISHGNLACKTSLKTHDEFEELGIAINEMLVQLQEKQHLRHNFERYVSQHMLEQILDAENVSKPEGERRKITVLISDIYQFAELSERFPPQLIISQMNEYLRAMLDVIFHYAGTFDKFLGSRLMIEFGAPLPDDKQEEHAILTAIGMQSALTQLNAKWTQENKPAMQMGMGIHTGLAVVGAVGPEQRIEFTVIGDTVDVASHLQQTAHALNKKIVVSEMTARKIKDKFELEGLRPITLPGRKEETQLYSVDF